MLNADEYLWLDLMRESDFVTMGIYEGNFAAFEREFPVALVLVADWHANRTHDRLIASPTP